MTIYHSQEDEGDKIMEDVIKFLEKETKKKVFTLRLTNEIENGFESIVVFEDKSVMLGFIILEIEGEHLKLNVKGDFV